MARKSANPAHSSSGSQTAKSPAKWQRKLEAVLETVGPELGFALAATITVAIGTFFGLDYRALELLSLVGLLVLAGEVIVRFAIHQQLRQVRSLDSHIRKFGLAVTDRISLRGLPAAYVDARACEVADLQRDLGEKTRYRLDALAVFPEMIRILELAREQGLEIRAVATHRLLDYTDQKGAEEYFKQNIDAAEHVSIRRVFVLDDQLLADERIRRLIENQNLSLMSKRGAHQTEPSVKWVLRQSGSSDSRYANHVESTYSDDWVLFGNSLLVRHDVYGVGRASMMTNREEIEQVERRFASLWEIGREPGHWEADRSLRAPQPTLKGEPRVVGKTHKRIVSKRAGDVGSENKEVA